MTGIKRIAYIIFDRNEQTIEGDWENADPDLYWKSSLLNSAVPLLIHR
jgi:hypothetical protein